MAGVVQWKSEVRVPARGRKKQGGRNTRGEREVTEGTDLDLHHINIVNDKNSYSLRESGSLKDSDGWLKE